MLALWRRVSSSNGSGWGRGLEETSSTIVPTKVKSDGDEGLAATQLAAPQPSDSTQVSEPGGATPPVPPVDAASLTAQLRNRERYQFVSEHGRGGLGRVSRAHDRDLGRDIAIKELISRDHVSEARFLREALITARLEHPGIVPIYEAGRWPDGIPFYAMKLVAGRSLRNLLAEHKTVDERIRLLHHVIAVADAIAYAHGKHIVHRDLKPANVIVGDFGETVVIDWGLAKDLTQAEESASGGGGPLHAAQDSDLTSVGTVLGTLAYMPPEQERGEPVDQRADVFAIGAMLWELCTLQKLPHSSSGQRQRILRRAGIDQDLIAIIDKAVDPDRARRYPDASALAADLKAFKAGARIAARRYSLPAMLAHWTRRHRTLALTGAAAAAVAVAGSVLYVRNISAERDLADAARQTAQRELDRAQLAEASLLVEKDPTSAKPKLASFTQHSPQYALLLSRANQAAATRVIKLPASAGKLLHHPDTSEIAIVTAEGVLESVDIDSGQLRVLDRDLLGPATSQRAGWLYARRPFKASAVTVTSTTGPVRALPAGSLLTELTSDLVAAGSRIYALDKHDLYNLTENGPVLKTHGVHSIAGNDHLWMVCTTAGELEVMRDGVSERHTRCVNNTSVQAMAVAGTSYAALLDPDHLLLVRNGKALELSTHIAGGYQLALAPGGLLAVADLGDKTWFVRPDGNRLELGPAHGSLPTTVAADDRFAAWGYADGAVIAIDTMTGAVWTFKGHTTHVTRLAVDPGHARLVSIAGPELRVWTLTPSPLREVPGVPCAVYTVAVSPDRTRAALDGYDGVLRVWSLATGSIHELHHHSDVAVGVAWWGDHACSAGLDHQVLCTSPDGTMQNVLSSKAKLGWLTSSPESRKLIVADTDGKIQEYDGSPRTLYIHDAAPYRMTFSSDGQWLASGAEDGLVIVYDFAHRLIDCAANAHTTRVSNVLWRGDELWTAGSDGTMARWRHHDHALTLVDRIREAAPFRFLHLLKNGWCGNVDSRILLVHLEAPPRVLRFDLGRHVEQLDVSPDERYIAATVAGEVVVVDLVRNTVASLSIPSDGIPYVGFTGPELLAISTSNGLFSVQPSTLAYINF
jgi:WD40 repeat protein